MMLTTLSRANSSLNLENQIKKVDGLVSGFEKNLSEDGPITDVPNAIQARADDIKVRTLVKLNHIHATFFLPTSVLDLSAFETRASSVLFSISGRLWQQLRAT